MKYNKRNALISFIIWAVSAVISKGNLYVAFFAGAITGIFYPIINLGDSDETDE
jgi:hypothetical protein